VAKTAASLEAGSELFAKAAKLIGGGEPARSVKADYTVVLSLGGQAMTLGQSVDYVPPDKMRMVMKTPMGEQTLVINGDKGYAASAGQSRPLPGEMVADQREDLNRDLVILAGAQGRPDFEAVAAGSAEVDGTACDVAAVSLAGTESRLCIAADGKVLKQTYQGQHPMQRTPGKMEIVFSDYRDVGGRMLPHKQVMTFEGQPLATISVNSISINGDVESSLFDLPDGE